jgi:hypothetical protein
MIDSCLQFVAVVNKVVINSAYKYGHIFSFLFDKSKSEIMGSHGKFMTNSFFCSAGVMGMLNKQLALSCTPCPGYD